MSAAEPADVDVDALYASSEYARIILAEAVHLVRDPDREHQVRLGQAIAEALDQENVDPAAVVSMLAMSAAEAWIRAGAAVGLGPIEILRVVVGNWSDGEHQLFEALKTIAAAGEPAPPAG